MTRPTGNAEAERHRNKMAKRKAVQDAEIASKTAEKGLLIVHTGTGKGKVDRGIRPGAARARPRRARRRGAVHQGRLAHRRARRAREVRAQVAWHTMGEGFTWETQDRARDVAAAQRAWTKARELLARSKFRLLVILDELNIALRYDYLDLADVLASLARAPAGLHVVVTGRNAKPELVAAADLVTEMTLVKHHFAAGVKAQPGIEF
jgi:cob(I)alamin adenosyltransferase